jgi:hypothetical protein
MSRTRHPDNPDYAIDVIEGAKPISTQLSVATGLFAVLLIAMSAVATPMRPQDPVAGDAQATGMEESSSSGQGPWCLSGNKVRDWIAVVAA